MTNQPITTTTPRHQEDAMTTTQPETKTVSLESLTGAEIITVDVGLPATHRCDRCDAQAFVEVEMPSKSVLLFCAHHYRDNADALVLQALRIVDHTPYLAVMEAKFKGQLQG